MDQLTLEDMFGLLGRKDAEIYLLRRRVDKLEEALAQSVAALDSALLPTIAPSEEAAVVEITEPPA